MASFVLDFSAYNALLSSSSHGSAYFGADDPFLGGGDPGLSSLAGRRTLHQIQQQQQQHQQQQHHLHHHHHGNQAHPAGPHHPNAHSTIPRHVHNRFLVYDRNSLARLDAEKTLQDRRKQHIANFGATWLKPPGVAKTLFQIREECREQETAPTPAVAAGVDTDMLADEHDLDDAVADADAEEFSFGNNNDDGDDPFASSSDDEDEDDEGEDDVEGEEQDEEEASAVQEQNEEGDGDGDGDDNEEERNLPPSQRRGVYDPVRSRYSARHVSGQAGAGASAGAGAAASAHTVEPATPAVGQAVDDDPHEQARARAAERREMRQMRATEDRMRSSLGGGPATTITTTIAGEHVGHSGNYLLDDGDPDFAPGVGDDVDMDMDVDADLDHSGVAGPASIVAMDLNTFDGGYEHTDTEAELGDSSSSSSSTSSRNGDGRTHRYEEVADDDEDDDDDDLPQHSFLAAATAISGSMASVGGVGGTGGFAPGPRSSVRFRSSLARSDRNSLDISSLLSRDGSSNMGSSPRMRQL
ncbi:Anaphase-promoting complex, subunit 15/MND2 [Niveomyces insectorum RCEF 264]|uniref:Anaphase-promoting complex, subunit 15/MND2 n=1 Tax=Niveomyces insectorum RCEF 264 TaxID=1081102 RepID=A0A167ZS62_9HYPO|nr:Anaphase-promoting complex, subunit 15/MND2 [Niveomyces insectorum RCEF 264]